MLRTASSRQSHRPSTRALSRFSSGVLSKPSKATNHTSCHVKDLLRMGKPRGPGGTLDVHVWSSEPRLAIRQGRRCEEKPQGDRGPGGHGGLVLQLSGRRTECRAAGVELADRPDQELAPAVGSLVAGGGVPQTGADRTSETHGRRSVTFARRARLVLRLAAGRAG